MVLLVNVMVARRRFVYVVVDAFASTCQLGSEERTDETLVNSNFLWPWF